MSEVPRPTSTSARAARNAAIARDRAAGLPWATIATRFGLSERQARRAAEDAAAHAWISDPEAVADRVVHAHLRALDVLDRLAGSSNSSVAVGAARSLPNAARSLLDVLRSTGTIPTDHAGMWRDVPVVLRAVLQTAARHGLLDAVRKDLELDVRADERRGLTVLIPYDPNLRETSS